MAALPVLRRADRAWCQETADEHLDEVRLRHLAAAAETGLGAQERTAAQAAEVDQLRAQCAAADQRREDLRVELWKHIDVQQRRAEQAEHQRNTWKGEYDRLVDELAESRAEAERQRKLAEFPIDDEDLAELRDENERLRGECQGLAGRLIEVSKERDQARAEAARVRALKVVDVAAEVTAAQAEPARHRHAWEVQPGLKYIPLPCACGKPWPRNRPPDLAP